MIQLIGSTGCGETQSRHRVLEDGTGILLILALIAGLPGCGGGDDATGPGGGDNPGSVTIAGLISDERGSGVEDARVAASGPDSANQYTDAEGGYRLEGLEPGGYTLSIRLPPGYEAPGDRQAMVEATSGTETVDFTVSAVREVEQTVDAGERDTAYLAGGSSVAVDASAATEAVNLNVRTVDPAESGLNADATLSDVMRVRIVPSSGGSADAPGVAAADATSGDVTVTFHQAVPQDRSDLFQAREGHFLFIPSPDEQATPPVRFYGQHPDRTTTRTRIAENGAEQVLASYEVRASSHESEGGLETLVSLIHSDASCDDDYRELSEARSGRDASDRRPLVLIHGWQPLDTRCENFEDFPVAPRWETVVGALRDAEQVDDRYKVYYLSYPTNAPVSEAAAFLNSALEARGLEDAVLVGHSMGGLVARDAQERDNGGLIGIVLTLGTPHEGALLAEVAASLTAAIEPFGPYLPEDFRIAVSDLGLTLFPYTPGVRDLQPSSSFIRDLMARSDETDRVVALGGDLTESLLKFPEAWSQPPSWTDPPVWLEQPIYLEATALFLEGLDEIVEHDGAVSGASAIPIWAYPQARFFDHFFGRPDELASDDPTRLQPLAGYDHLEVLGGRFESGPGPVAAIEREALRLFSYSHVGRITEPVGLTNSIWIYDPSGLGPEKLTSGSIDLGFTEWRVEDAPIWFQRLPSADSEDADLFKIEPDGSGLVEMAGSSHLEIFDEWSPSFDRALFHSDRNGDWDVWTVRKDGSGLARITDDPAADLFSSWGPDGERIVFQSYRDGNWNLYLKNMATGALTQLTTSSNADVDPVWSPSGEWIAFETNRHGKWDVYRLNPDDPSEMSRIVDEPAGSEAGDPIWSPDGATLVFETRRDGDWDLATVSADGGDRTALTESGGDDLNPDFSPRGTEILFLSDRRGEGDVFHVYIASTSRGGVVPSTEVSPPAVPTGAGLPSGIMDTSTGVDRTPEGAMSLPPLASGGGSKGTEQ